MCVHDDKIVAVFYYDYGYKIEPTYNVIENGAWIGDDNYGVVHRIATDGGVKGAGTFCIYYAFNQCKHWRIDTHNDKLIRMLNFPHIVVFVLVYFILNDKISQTRKIKGGSICHHSYMIQGFNWLKILWQ